MPQHHGLRRTPIFSNNPEAGSATDQFESQEPPPRALQSRPPWTRSDQKRLATWLLIAFGIPGVLLIGWMWLTGRNESSFSLEYELVTKCIAAFFALLATWIVSRMENRPLSDYGIPPRQALGLRFWEGSAWGFAMLSALLLLLRLSGNFRIDSVALRPREFLMYALGWAIAFWAVAIAEEFGFRGYLLFVASRRIRFWPAAIALSVGFAAAHIPNPGETLIGILQVLGTGLLFCFMIRRTGNLWFALGYHAAWDWAQTFFYGTPDSGLVGDHRFLNSTVLGPAWIGGGSTGPEGSIVALVALAVCALLIHARFPRAMYPDRPA